MGGMPSPYPSVEEHKKDLSKDFPPDAGAGSTTSSTGRGGAPPSPHGGADDGPPPAYFPPDLGPSQQSGAPPPSAPRNNLDLPELPSIPMDSPARGENVRK